MPERYADAYRRAERCVRRYFADQEIDREAGTIMIGGERYVLLRTAGIATAYFEDLVGIYADVGDEAARRTARNLLFELGHKVGQSDARSLAGNILGSDTVTKVLAGTIQFSYAGGSRVDIHKGSRLTPDEGFVLVYDMSSTIESHERALDQRVEDRPACTISGGYLAGWCESLLDDAIVATEILCRAKRDPVCRFVLAPRTHIEQAVIEHLGLDPEHTDCVAYYEVPETGTREHKVLETHGLVARLQEAQRTRSRMLKQIAHDIGTPVTSLYLQTYLLKRRARQDPVLAETVTILQESAARLTQFVRDLKDVSAMEEGTRQIEKQPTDLLRIAERVLGLLRPAADKMGIGMQISASGDAWVPGDPARLGQLLRILLSNALKFSKPGQQVRVALRRTGAEVEVTVRDEGAGIEPNDLAKLFRPFEQVHDPATTPYKGSGLGLYIARWIVHEHGGRIHAESGGRGQGATFTFSLPAADPVEEAVARRSGRRLEGEVGRTDVRGARSVPRR